MKKMKLWVLASALVSVMGLSSCLGNGKYDGTSQGMEFVRVNKMYGVTLTNQYGIELIPSSSELVENLDASKFTLAYYSYDASTVTAGQKTVNVNLLGASSVPDGNGVIGRAPTKEDANVPVYSIGSSDNSSGSGFYKLEDMFLPVGFYTIPDMDATQLKNELAKHQFTLYYDAATDMTDGTLTLHLRHNLSDASDEETNKKRTRYAFSYFHFMIGQPLSEYKAKYKNKTPDVIKIAYEQNQSGVNYPTSGSTQEQIYTIDYKTIVYYYNVATGNTDSSDKQAQ